MGFRKNVTEKSRAYPDSSRGIAASDVSEKGSFADEILAEERRIARVKRDEAAIDEPIEPEGKVEASELRPADVEFDSP